MNRSWWLLPVLLLAGCGGSGTAPSAAPGDTFTFGVIMVGPYNDHGWSAAHYTAGRYVEAQQPGTRMLYVDNVNPVAKPGLTIPQVVDDLITKGARLIIATSDDFQDGICEAAARHPETPFLNVSGDQAWPDGRNYRPLPNLSNCMGRMEYARMISGFVAALTTRTGKIGYLGPLINAETRRFAAAAYLGARYAWVEERKQDPQALQFAVKWIGFWFNIPGQTLDPGKVSAEFFHTGYDVVISAIDTTEALVEAGKQRRVGREVWAIPYDYRDACEEVPDAALGVPYFNWGPAYGKAVKLARDGRWMRYFDWTGPDWNDINDPDRSAIGFVRGRALSAATSAKLDAFITGLGNGSINLFCGPLNWQDGSVFLPAGSTVSDTQLWYLPHLLQGMTGAGE